MATIKKLNFLFSKTLKKFLILFFLFFVLSSSLWGQNLPERLSSPLYISPYAKSNVHPFKQAFTLNSRSPHHPLLNLTYSPLYSHINSPYGKGWLPAYKMHLKILPRKISLLNPAGEPLISFRKPFRRNRFTLNYISPSGKYKTSLPLPIRLSRSPSAFILYLPGGIEYRFNTKGRLSSLRSSKTKDNLYYSPRGLLEKIKGTRGLITINYDPNTYLAESISSSKGKTYFHYIGKKLSQVVHPDGYRQEYIYDYQGRISVYQGYGKLSYGKDQRRLALFDYKNNKQGRVQTIRLANGLMRKYTYLPRGLRVADQKGFLYEIKRLSKKMVSYTSPGKKIVFTFNKAGQITKMVSKHKGHYPYEIRFHYSRSGNLLYARLQSHKASPITSKVTFKADGMGRLKSVYTDSGEKLIFKYDHNFGATITSQAKKKLSYKYDRRGRIHQVRGNNESHRFIYDLSKGGLRKIISSGSGKSEVTHIYGGKDGRLEQIQFPRGDKKSEDIFKMSYSDGRLIGIKSPLGDYYLSQEKGKIVPRKWMEKGNKRDYFKTKNLEIILGKKNRQGKRLYVVLLRDYRRRIRAIIRSDGQYRLVLIRPTSKYKAPKGFAGRLAKFLDTKVDIASRYYNGPESGFAGYIIGNTSTFLAEDSIDALRLGEGTYGSYRDLQQGRYLNAGVELVSEGFRVLTIVDYGLNIASFAKRGLRKIGRETGIFLTQKRLLNQVSKTPVITLTTKKLLKQELPKKIKNGLLLSKAVRRLASIQKSFRKLKAVGRKKPLFGMIRHIKQMKGIKKAKAQIRNIVQEEISLGGQCNRFAKNMAEKLEKKGYMKLRPDSLSQVPHLETEARELWNRGKKVIVLKHVNIGDLYSHEYLKIFDKNGIYIIDPTLSGNIRSIYGKSIVPLSHKPRLLSGKVSGLFSKGKPVNIVLFRKSIFTLEEHKDIIDKIKHLQKMVDK